ncbi:SAP30-binding protein [Strongylocentrotus purpuratus]|uniref:SAP30-binding protein n=1 Tax=Strongylocentrotus purpuratus TaxID=7668 RepID=A0A7M7PHB2_STRPU|nr:SAP30-binding protein-like [Strongylocentrotus purpuratus]XP_030849306.1 SAP30-binding protein [Strongylocentrotus purpuratus]
MSHNDGGMRRLTHLVSYTSDSDEERVREDDEEDVMESIPEEERVGDEDAEIEAMQMSETERSFKESPSPSSNAPSLVSYEREESKGTRTTGLVAYEGEDDDGGRRSKEGGGEEGDYHDESWLEAKLSPGDDLEDRVKVDKGKLVDSSYFNASMSLPESALSQKIRRLSAEEVTLPPEPPGRCSRHLQEKISSYYKKNLNLNQIIQRRKDFRNPSIYEKMINFLGVDELGTNYPKDMYDPYSWKESSYYEALAKAQREEIQKKKEKDKKEKTKVEFVTGVVRKTQIQAPLVTSTTGVAVPSTSTINQGTGHEEEKKRKSKWDNPAQTLPAPVPLMQRPIITVITTTIPTSTGVSTTTSAAGSKTTVISSIGAIKKQKVEK